MIGWILSTLITCVIVIFLIHFVGLYISKKIFEKRAEKQDFNNTKLFKGNRLFVYLTSDKSLMVSKHHYGELWMDDYDTNYSRDICLTIGGFYFIWKYGSEDKAYVNPDKYGDDDVTKYYGLYSTDSNIWWDSIWWGKHLYNNPFYMNKFLGCWLFDFNKAILVNAKTVDKFSKEYDETIPYPYIVEMEHVQYINKNNETQIVPYIAWTIEDRRWTAPILNLFGLGKFFYHQSVDLTFDIQGRGENFGGLGIEHDTYKGGVYGASIRLSDYPELLNMYNNITRRNRMDLVSQFKHEIFNLIENFMTNMKKY